MSLRVPIWRSPRKLAEARSRVGISLKDICATSAVKSPVFYVSLPAINPQSGDFYSFLCLLCVVYSISVFLLAAPVPESNSVVRTPVVVDLGGVVGVLKLADHVAEGAHLAVPQEVGGSPVLRFQYPTMMFSTPEFEINEEGHPFWIAPRVVKRIGLFGGVEAA